jgi:hypothetical protein
MRIQKSFLFGGDVALRAPRLEFTRVTAVCAKPALESMHASPARAALAAASGEPEHTRGPLVTNTRDVTDASLAS